MLKIAGNYPQGLRVFKMVNDSNSKSSFTWDTNLWRLYERGGEIHFLVKGKSANVKKIQEIVIKNKKYGDFFSIASLTGKCAAQKLKKTVFPLV